MSQTSGAAFGADHSRARIESLLARYPLISADEVDEMRRWFRQRATALDMGLLASNEALEPQYRRFRAEQLDRFGLRDILLIAAVSAVVIVGVIAATVL